ncbi:MAG: hypothetical protein HYX78_06140 [Armatimonadetes bacterium]|nr:hypothetical protein [Armatimonadota bacterium]
MRLSAAILIFAMLTACVPVGAQSNSIVIVSPGAGDLLSGQRAEISISYSTSPSDSITRIELDVNGVQYGVKHMREPSSRGIASFLIDSTRLGNGAHTLLVRAYSGSRLVASTSGGCKVGNGIIDTTPPDVQFAGIKPGQVLSGVKQIEVSAKDEGGVDPLVSVLIDKSLKLIKNIPPYTYIWNTMEYTNGAHVLEAYAFDGAGNRGEAEAVEVMVKNAGVQLAKKDVVKPESVASAAPAPSKSDVTAEAAQPAQPVVPQEHKPARETAARSAESGADVGGPVNTPAAETEGRRTASAASESEGLVKPEAQSESVERPAKLSVDMPATQSEPDEEAVVVAALPSDVIAPTEPVIPSATEPVASPVVERPAVDAPHLRSVESWERSNQKLARPQTREAVQMARAPKPEHSTLDQGSEARKIRVRLEKDGSFVAASVELRYAIEAAGGSIIFWDAKAKTAVAVLEGKKLTVQVDSPQALVSGRVFKLARPPYINNEGRTVVDVRLIKSILGSKLELVDGEDESALEYDVDAGSERRQCLSCLMQ